MNKKGLGVALIILLVLVGIIVLGVLWVMGSYNGLVSSDTSVEKSWGNVQSAYQRRIDLIPNLVATVKGSAEFEKSMQTQIAQLRSGASNAKTTSDFTNIDSGINRAINIVVEAYPNVKSTDAFLQLQSQLEGTENRIKYERDNYNTAVQQYKLKVRSFPSNIIAGMFGFDLNKWNTFAADEGADKAPNVDFG